jgi:hypothetical protein
MVVDRNGALVPGKTYIYNTAGEAPHWVLDERPGFEGQYTWQFPVPPEGLPPLPADAKPEQIGPEVVQLQESGLIQDPQTKAPPPPEEVKIDDTKAKADYEASRKALQDMYDEYNNIASGKVKTKAELQFEDEYAKAAKSLGSTLNRAEGLTGGQRIRATGQAVAQLNANEEQQRALLRAQQAREAEQRMVQIAGLLGDQNVTQDDLEAAVKDTNRAMTELYDQGLFDRGMTDIGNRVTENRIDASNTLKNVGSKYKRGMGYVNAGVGAVGSVSGTKVGSK